MKAKFFPFLHTEFQEMDDKRSSKNSTYPLSIVMHTILEMFLCKLGSIRQITNYLSKGEIRFNRLLTGKEKLPHGDTTRNVAKQVKVDELEEILAKMTRRTIRMKILDKYRLEGYLLVAIDGTQTHTFSEKHCDNCLQRTFNKGKENERTQYYHYQLEARIVGANGYAIPLATEFVENKPSSDESDEFSKQDCELNAFKRLEKKIKKRFPRTQLCLLLDGLYANRKVMDICNKNEWHWIIVLKDGSLKTINAEFEEISKISLNELCSDETVAGECTYYDKTLKSMQTYKWVNHINYEDNSKKHDLSTDRHVHVLDCVERRENKKTTHWRWFSSIPLTRNNAARVANEGGRLRWKIENKAFHVLKRHGYNLEHLYCYEVNAMKAFILLMNMAHLLDQLFLLHWRKGKELVKFAKSIKKVWQHICNELCPQVEHDAQREKELYHKMFPPG